MKTFRSLVLAAVLPGAGALAQSTIPARPTALAGNPLIEAVRAAPDPSSAVEAYAQGIASGTVAPTQLERAYVLHMVAHGAPELADAQAHDLINRGAADATARGVAAYNDAARGNVRAAVGNLRLALIAAPADPFILRTAGQVVAWYDSQTDRSSLSKDDVTGIEWMRAVGKQRQEFADAYTIASEALRPEPAALAQDTAVPTTRNSSADAPSTANYGRGSTSYSYDYPYSYSYPYYGYAYGSYSVIALPDRDFYRDRHGPLFDRRNPPGRAGELRDGPPAGARGGAGGAPRQAPPRSPQPPGGPARPQGGPPQAPAQPPQPPLPPAPPGLPRP
jgi:hypothetical protein